MDQMVGGWVFRLLGGPRRISRDSTEEAEAEGNGGDDEPEPWVPVLTVFDRVQATIITARLQDEGIPAHIRQESASSVFPVTVGILGEIDVMVPKLMEEKALALIDALLGPDESNSPG
jgi:hypothetical protein